MKCIRVEEKDLSMTGPVIWKILTFKSISQYFKLLSSFILVGRGVKGIREEKYPLYLWKGSNKQNVLCNSNKNLDAYNFIKTHF